jgi:hypothetical protein
MNIKKFTSNSAFFIFFWIAYFLLSIFFYKERATYADNSFYLFEIIQTKTFHFEHHRYSAFFIQWLTVLFVKLNFPLKLVMLAQSVNIGIYLLASFLVVIYLADEVWQKYIYLICSVAVIHHVFFLIASELYLGINLLLLLCSVFVTNKIKESNKYIWITVIAILIMLSHQFILLIAVLVSGLFFLKKRDKFSFSTVFLFLFFIVIKHFLIHDKHDGNALSGMAFNQITLRRIHSGFFAKYFIKNLLNGYYVLPIILNIFFLIKIKTNKIYKVSALLLLAAVYILLTVFFKSETFLAYFDSYLSVFLVFSWLIVFLIIKDTDVKNSNILRIAVMVVLVLSFGRIFLETKYTHRVDVLEKMMQGKNSKFIYEYEKIDEELKFISWAIPYETLLISSENKRSKTVFVKEDKYFIDPFLTDSTKFLGADWTFYSPIELNKNYFNLPDETYQYIR